MKQDQNCWRTDPRYNEDAIRERLKAAKAEILPVSVMDTTEDKSDELPVQTRERKKASNRNPQVVSTFL